VGWPNRTAFSSGEQPAQNKDKKSRTVMFGNKRHQEKLRDHERRWEMSRRVASEMTPSLTE
jgi:hypothetical protein